MIKVNYEFVDSARQRRKTHDVRNMRLVSNLNLNWKENCEVFEFP